MSDQPAFFCNMEILGSMFRYLFPGVVATVGGFIAISGLVVRKMPNAQKIFDKLVPIQGVFGIVLLFWGLIQFWNCISEFNMFFPNNYIIGIESFIVAIVETVVGFILGYSFITQYMISQHHGVKTKEKIGALREKFLKIEIPTGLILLILGLFHIFQFLFTILR